MMLHRRALLGRWLQRRSVGSGRHGDEDWTLDELLSRWPRPKDSQHHISHALQSQRPVSSRVEVYTGDGSTQTRTRLRMRSIDGFRDFNASAPREMSKALSRTIQIDDDSEANCAPSQTTKQPEQKDEKEEASATSEEFREPMDASDEHVIPLDAPRGVPVDEVASSAVSPGHRTNPVSSTPTHNEDFFDDPSVQAKQEDTTIADIVNVSQTNTAKPSVTVPAGQQSDFLQHFTKENSAKEPRKPVKEETSLADEVLADWRAEMKARKSAKGSSKYHSLLKEREMLRGRVRAAAAADSSVHLNALDKTLTEHIENLENNARKASAAVEMPAPSKEPMAPTETKVKAPEQTAWSRKFFGPHEARDKPWGSANPVAKTSREGGARLAIRATSGAVIKKHDVPLSDAVTSNMATADVSRATPRKEETSAPLAQVVASSEKETIDLAEVIKNAMVEVRERGTVQETTMKQLSQRLDVLQTMSQTQAASAEHVGRLSEQMMSLQQAVATRPITRLDLFEGILLLILGTTLGLLGSLLLVEWRKLDRQQAQLQALRHEQERMLRLRDDRFDRLMKGNSLW